MGPSYSNTYIVWGGGELTSSNMLCIKEFDDIEETLCGSEGSFTRGSIERYLAKLLPCCKGSDHDTTSSRKSSREYETSMLATGETCLQQT